MLLQDMSRRRRSHRHHRPRAAVLRAARRGAARPGRGPRRGGPGLDAAPPQPAQALPRGPGRSIRRCRTVQGNVRPAPAGGGERARERRPGPPRGRHAAASPSAPARPGTGKVSKFSVEDNGCGIPPEHPRTASSTPSSPPGRPPAGPGWAWPSSRRSSSSTAGGSRWRAGWARGRSSASCCR